MGDSPNARDVSDPLGDHCDPDGALWFTERAPIARIGRITMDGTITNGRFLIPRATRS